MPVIQFSIPEKVYYYLEKTSIEKNLGSEKSPKPQALAKKIVVDWYFIKQEEIQDD